MRIATTTFLLGLQESIVDAESDYNFSNVNYFFLSMHKRRYEIQKVSLIVEFCFVQVDIKSDRADQKYMIFVTRFIFSKKSRLFTSVIIVKQDKLIPREMYAKDKKICFSVGTNNIFAYTNVHIFTLRKNLFNKKIHISLKPQLFVCEKRQSSMPLK